MSEPIITFLASFVIWIMFLGILILWLVDGRIKKEAALHAFMAATIAWVIAEMVKNLVPSIRPFSQNGLTPLTLTVPFGHAFPSEHSAVAGALATSIFMHKKTLGLIFFLAAGGVGIGRILGNVHNPLDILGGALLGGICAVLIKKFHLFKIVSGKR